MRCEQSDCQLGSLYEIAQLCSLSQRGGSDAFEQAAYFRLPHRKGVAEIYYAVAHLLLFLH